MSKKPLEESLLELHLKGGSLNHYSSHIIFYKVKQYRVKRAVGTNCKYVSWDKHNIVMISAAADLHNPIGNTKWEMVKGKVFL